MKKYTNQFITKQWQRAAALVAALTLLVGIVAPITANAAQITGRSLLLSSSSSAASNATTSYTFNFTLPSSTVVKSFSAQLCTDTGFGGSCTPTGFSNSGGSVTTVTHMGDTAGSWTYSTGAADSLRMSDSGNAIAPTASQTVTFSNIQNPTTANQTFYVKITTYSTATYTTPIDSGIVAASTASQITLTGTMNESLTFCVGTSITGQDCTTIAGSSINFGSFSSTATSHDTSVMAAASNAGTGYSITVNGTTLTCASCGGATIAALATQTASATSGPQFGFNLKANATPSFGVNPSGDSGGTANTNYATADSYRFVTGDTVAGSTAGTNSTAYTSAYIVNVPPKQAAGSYSATLTYICTANY